MELFSATSGYLKGGTCIYVESQTHSPTSGSYSYNSCGLANKAHGEMAQTTHFPNKYLKKAKFIQNLKK